MRTIIIGDIHGCNRELCGLLDKDGQVLLPFEYENIFPSPTEQLITVQQAGQWKVINPKGETVFEIGK